MSLVTRLHLLVVLAVLPAIGIQGWDELILRRDREVQVRAEALRLAQSAAGELDGILDGARTLLLSLAAAPSVRRQDAVACRQLVTELAHGIEKYVAVGAVDGSGRWFCAGDDVPVASLDASGTAWFETGRKGEGFAVGTYTQNPLTGRGVLPMTLPFAGPDGRTGGLVHASLDLAWLSRHFAARVLPPGATLAVTSRDGSPILRLPEAAQVGQPVREELRWMLAADRPGVLAGIDDDASRIIAYVPPAATTNRSLLVIVSLSPREALPELATASWRGLLLIGSCLLLALAAAHFAGRAFIVQPVEALLRAAERWRAGDFGARAGLADRHSELARLGAAFDGMAASLEAHEAQMQETLEALKESEARFRQFAENSHDVLWIFDRQRNRHDYISPAFAQIWGRSGDALLRGEIAFLDTVHPDDRAKVEKALPEVLGGREVALTYRIVRPDGGIRWIRDSGFPIRDGAGRIVRAGGICRDVTEWAMITQERERSLRERELMLREINHRVKNNLQVIISLLRLQANRSGSDEVRDAFDEACGRVSTITELHSALFEGTQISTLDFGSYLHELCARLEAGMRGARVGEIRIEVDSQPGSAIDLDRAVPLGLIVNELVTNAIRHGLADRHGGTVQVRFRPDGDRYVLSVHDDGPGIVANGETVLEQGLGMQLVHGFVKRLQGTLTIDGTHGFEAVVNFPARSERHRRETGPEPRPEADPALPP
ncbi:sensor histidine kinase [Benzoatithermus flavus]|uniref:histidine kinase n=1 Tax=Benzoatithermus flavus TaxID=3108223 RepID=A0ABU8XX07_9PROT